MERPPGKLRVQLFGPFRVEGSEVLGPRSFGGVKPKQLLEILFLSRGRLVPKDVLAEHLRPQPQKVRDGHYVLQNFVFPIAGDWRLDVSVRTSDVDQSTVPVTVSVR